MNLNTIRAVQRPTSAAEVTSWRNGVAWLAGGTWLYSEPQPALDTLIDLEGLGWPPLETTSAGLTIAATCRIAELYRYSGPVEWKALPLIRQCCDAFLASFKIWNAATVGGNVCMSLPAGPMTSLTSALQGVCTLLPRQEPPREIPVVDFVIGNTELHRKCLNFRELHLRHLPRSNLNPPAVQNWRAAASSARAPSRLGAPSTGMSFRTRRRRGFCRSNWSSTGCMWRQYGQRRS